MSAQVTCPVCKTRCTVADNLLGRTIPCKKCQEMFVAQPAEEIPTVAAVEDEDVPVVEAIKDDRAGAAPVTKVSRSPLLLFALGAGGALGLIAVAGGLAYFLWPDEPPPPIAKTDTRPPKIVPPPIITVPPPAKEKPKVDAPPPKAEPKVEPMAKAKTDPPKTEEKTAASKTEPAAGKDATPPNDKPKAEVKAVPPPKPEPPPVPLVPDTPLIAAIRPPDLASDREMRLLPSAVGDVCVAAGGRYLVFTMPRARQLAVFDVNEAKVVKTLPLSEEGAKVTAGANVIVVCNPEAHTLERWSLTTLRKEGPVPCPLAQPVVGLALGSASDGPLLVAAGADPRRFGAALKFLNPATFKEVPIKPVEQSEYGFRVGKTSQLRASADGRMFTSWVPGDRERGPQTLVVTGPRFQVFTESEAAGYLAPGPDARFLFTGRGVALPDGRPTTGTPNGLAIPTIAAVHGPAYLCLQLAGNNPAAKTATASLMVPGRSEPLRVWNDIELPARATPDNNDSFTFDKRLILIPAAKLLVAVPTTNDRLTLVKLDLPASPKPVALTVTSTPPPLTSRGTTFNYAITIHPLGRSPTFFLEEGPPGLIVSLAGAVTWAVPEKQPLEIVKVRVAIRAADGAEIKHEFRVAVQEQMRTLTTPK